MININGKEWAKLTVADIEALVSDQDTEESFYFEFKEDKVAPSKVVEEISALANTFGGYIFLGISDSKDIAGCTEWNEQRIHVTIHDSITPTPSFDVKPFSCKGKNIYVIKIDEGAEPPYITSRGKIYERLSSGSFPIKDSVRLSQIYNKREQLLSKMEAKISIPPINEKPINIFGYIDIGFSLVLSDIQTALDAYTKADLKQIAESRLKNTTPFNLTHVGNSIIYTPGGISTDGGFLPAHTNNFLEIMADGSARMRVLLTQNDPKDSVVNMVYAATFIRLYKETYTYIMGELFPEKMAYAKKYEALTVLKQFHPAYYYDDSILESHPEWKEQNNRIISLIQKRQEIMGIDTIVTNDRIPKTGLYTIDKRLLQGWGFDYTADSIIEELFYSRYANMGFIKDQELLSELSK